MKEMALRLRPAFTLVELIVVITVIAILASVVFVAVDPAKRFNAAKDSRRLNNAESISKALNQYLVDNGSLPAGIPSGAANAKQICRTGITDATCVSLSSALAVYIKSLPVDDIETSALYTGYTVYSMGGGVVVLPLYLGGTASASPTDYIGYWKFDETSGTSAVDSSGNGNTGTHNNGPTISTTVAPTTFSNARSLQFDGTDDYVSAPVARGSTVTFSMWATWNGAGSPMLFLAGNEGSGPDLFFYAGSICWNTWDGCANPFGSIPASASNGSFHHYALVAETGNTKLYYDGVLLGSANYVNPSGTTVFNIGGGSSWRWGGRIDDVRLYNRALTATEIGLLAAGK
jgi:prepilin-type N-terminal cleavage/methylation domain-containing protein